MHGKPTCPSWRIPDGLWARMEPFLPKYHASSRGGRPRLELRKVADGIFYILRTGCQWKAAPHEFGSGSSLHRYFQEWRNAMSSINSGSACCVATTRCAVSNGSGKVWTARPPRLPWAGKKTGPNPTDRGKSGVKRSLLTDGRGVPLGLAVDGANRHDQKLFRATLDSIPVRRPRPTSHRRQHLCCDKGFDAEVIRREARRRRYTPHIKSRGDEQIAKRLHGRRARRWVVERLHSWMNRFRRILIRWEKKADNYQAFLHFACAYITWNQT